MPIPKASNSIIMNKFESSGTLEEIYYVKFIYKFKEINHLAIKKLDWVDSQG